MVGAVVAAEVEDFCRLAEFLAGGDLGRARVVAEVPVEAGQGQAVVLQEDPAAGADDLHALCPDALAGGQDEGAGHFVGIIQDQGRLVVHGEVVVLAERNVGVDGLRESEKTEPEVEQVVALVDQGAAALAGPAAAPAAGGVIELRPEEAAVLETHAADPADGAFPHKIPDLHVLVVGALVAHHGVDPAGAGGRLIHGEGVRGGRAGGLVAHHMLPRGKSADRHGGMLLVGRHDDDGVESVRRLVQGVLAAADLHVRAEIRPGPGGPLVAAAADSCQGQPFDLPAVQHDRVFAAHIADADHGAPDILHFSGWVLLH